MARSTVTLEMRAIGTILRFGWLRAGWNFVGNAMGRGACTGRCMDQRSCFAGRDSHGGGLDAQMELPERSSSSETQRTVRRPRRVRSTLAAARRPAAGIASSAN